jgi:hypothetical protein
MQDWPCSDSTVTSATISPHRRRPPLFTTSLTVALLLSFSGCSPNVVVDHLEVGTSGVNKESFRWKLSDSEARGKHQVFVALENDPAKLMGLDAGARTYRAAVSLRLKKTNGEAIEKMLAIPISEMRSAGESADGRTSFIAPKVSGEPQPNGMFRTEPTWAFSFDASPGDWTLEASLMAPYNTDRRGLLVIRQLLIETRSRSNEGEELTGWTAVPKEALDSQETE